MDRRHGMSGQTRVDVDKFWGGLRGGISVALPLSRPSGPERDLLLSITYVIVLGSILIQGLTIGPLVKKIYHETTRQGRRRLKRMAAARSDGA